VTFHQIIVAKYWGMLVAVKRIKNAASWMQSSSQDSIQYLIQQFKEEETTLSRLLHNNIVRFYGSSLNADSLPMLVMEYCDHGTLMEVLANVTIEIKWPEVHKIATDCARGLAFLHSRARVHHDIKSLNVLLTGKEWTAKV
jgi:serine/threonine protein kinase